MLGDAVDSCVMMTFSAVVVAGCSVSVVVRTGVDVGSSVVVVGRVVSGCVDVVGRAVVDVSMVDVVVGRAVVEVSA